MVIFTRRGRFRVTFTAIVLPLLASPTLSQGLPADHVARAEWIERQADAAALVILCDRDMYVTRREPVEVDKLTGFHIERLKIAYAAVKGPRACVIALERYGPNGTVQTGLVAEGKPPPR
jgi:hypothetical protein